MKIQRVANVPVLPPSPGLAESQRQFEAGAAGLVPLNSMETSEAEQEWLKHKEENNYNPKVLAFGKPIGPGDRLLAYSRALKGRNG